MGGILKNAGAALGFGTSTSGVNGAGQMSEDEAYRQIQILKAQEANQRAFGDQLYNQAAGKAPSFAEAQMRQSQDRNLAQQMAMAKANRSANAGLQSRNVQMNAAAGGQAVNQAAGMAKMLEQQQNQAQYSNYLGGLQNSAQGMLGVNNQAQNQAFNANMQNDANLRKGFGEALGMATSGGTSIVNMFKTPTPEGGGMASTVPSSEAFTMGGGMLSGGAGAGAASMAGPAMISDKNEKTNIKQGSSKNFLDALTAYEYDYKNSKNGEGKHMSVMAQDLEKAGPVGKSMVQDVQGTKVVDYGKGFGAILAAQADLNKRLAEIESKYGKKR